MPEASIIPVGTAAPKEVLLAFRSFALVLIICLAAAGQAPERQTEGPASETIANGTRRASAVAAVVPSDEPYRPLAAEQRWNLYLHETFLSVHSYIRAPLGGLVDQAKDRPPQWEQGVSGYARRTGSAWGRYTLRDTYEATSAAALGYDVRYVRCRCSGIGRRLGYAMASSVFTRDRNGRIVPAVTRIGSEFAAEYSARLWLPTGYQSDSRIARGVLFQTGIRSLVNTCKEFTPELKTAVAPEVNHC